MEGERLTGWITEAMTSGLPGVSTFAVGLNSDYAAVEAGLTSHWNSGHVEGAVNRIKMLNGRCSDERASTSFGNVFCSLDTPVVRRAA